MMERYCLRDGGDITRGIRGALLGEAEGLLDALYDPEGEADRDVRGLVVMARDDAARLFAMAREKLGLVTCEGIGEEMRGTSYAGRFLINGTIRIEVVVDDLFERGGGLRTRDLVRIRPVEGE
ncbi:MAG: hypothetical protein IT372_03750 [Polyangiaceae bacterium]|nr:hypothetical protein [Polyangiaceae bacterium]